MVTRRSRAGGKRPGSVVAKALQHARLQIDLLALIFRSCEMRVDFPLVGLLAFAIVSCGGGTETTAQMDTKWYEGGTLHKATAAEWSSASPSNQLATAGDWSAIILGETRVRELGLDGLRSHAQQMVACVNTAISDGPSNQAVSEVAAGCSILMNQ